MSVTAFPLQWPAGWPRSKARTAAKFNQKVSNGRYNETKDVTVAVARDRLQRELDLLRATYPTLSTNVELRLDGQPRSDRRDPDDPGVAVYFRLAGKDTVLACDKWDRVADNIVAIAKHIEALRGMDRWGVGTMAQAFAGYQSLPAPEQWFQVLGVRQNATPEEIRHAYREKAKSAHPDSGGSDAAMARLNAARDQGLGMGGAR
ncbi:J domain-containing protein [Sphingobium fluviale]|uniref:J domain-containing protein n=1 Tax=Sphingobium fluviale TaxID=2506423 RepID=A0A4Q1KFW5_9SPHN|nr:J domain-containing protein [Sphingobium fluviale]RXR27717.1 J domain-containing protein [Sphingobium fluviale]